MTLHSSWCVRALAASDRRGRGAEGMHAWVPQRAPSWGCSGGAKLKGLGPVLGVPRPSTIPNYFAGSSVSGAVRLPDHLYRESRSAGRSSIGTCHVWVYGVGRTWAVSVYILISFYTCFKHPWLLILHPNADVRVAQNLPTLCGALL